MANAVLLALRLEGVLQSWGDHAKWETRDSADFPSKSGVVGLLACAMGLERDNPEITALSDSVQIAVRADRPGTRMLDFHTVQGRPRLYTAAGARTPDKSTIVSKRWYLQDASFLVLIETDEPWRERICQALKAPKWPIYLGRKSCVPSRPVLDGITTEYEDLLDALRRQNGRRRRSIMSARSRRIVGRPTTGPMPCCRGSGRLRFAKCTAGRSRGRCAMYLTKIDLERASRRIQFALADCQQLHRLVMGLFGTDRKSSHVLYRLRDQDRALSLYLYSDGPIDQARLLPGMHFAGERDLSDWLSQMEAGQIRGFDLLAAPTKKVPTETGRNSQRRILRTEEERLAWLARKGEQNGFRLLQCQELENHQQRGYHKKDSGGPMYVTGYHYQGLLQITDSERFRHAFQEGIGSGRAYGLGMLLPR